jgi:hypothetical protein
MTNEITAFEAASTSPDFTHFRFVSWRTSGSIIDHDDWICRVYGFATTDGVRDSGPSVIASLTDAKVAREILVRAGRIKI